MRDGSLIALPFFIPLKYMEAGKVLLAQEGVNLPGKPRKSRPLDQGQSMEVELVDPVVYRPRRRRPSFLASSYWPFHVLSDLKFNQNNI
jgi:hypothetical protein